MTTLLQELDEVLAKVSRASCGPWVWSSNGNIVPFGYPHGADNFEIAAVYSEHDDDATPPANAEAIIALRNLFLTSAPQIRAALALEAKLNDGWVLVPREPTQTQFDAGFKACEKQYHNEYLDDQFKKTIAIYQAMLNAAPPAGKEVVRDWNEGDDIPPGSLNSPSPSILQATCWDIDWIIRQLDQPEKAAKGQLRGMDAIKFVAERCHSKLKEEQDDAH